MNVALTLTSRVLLRIYADDSQMFEAFIASKVRDMKRSSTGHFGTRRQLARYRI